MFQAFICITVSNSIILGYCSSALFSLVPLAVFFSAGAVVFFSPVCFPGRPCPLGETDSSENSGAEEAEGGKKTKHLEVLFIKTVVLICVWF